MEPVKISAFWFAAAAAFLVVAMFYSSRQGGHADTSDTILVEIKSLLEQRQHALDALQQQPFVEPDLGVMGAYLAKARRDGVTRHAEMKQRLDDVYARTVELNLLVGIYEPRAKTAEFRVEARKYRAYALMWLDRWNSVFEVFMAGGNYPVAEVPFPEGLAAAVAAEISAR